MKSVWSKQCKLESINVVVTSSTPLGIEPWRA